VKKERAKGLEKKERSGRRRSPRSITCGNGEGVTLPPLQPRNSALHDLSSRRALSGAYGAKEKSKKKGRVGRWSVTVPL